MPKLASLDTMIVTTLFFIVYIISSLLRVIWGYFYRCLFLQIYKCFWCYSDGHYTKNNLSCHVLLCWGLFWHILGPILVWGILFLENRSIFFLWNFLQIFKWPYFMDWVQLSHGYRATTTGQFTFSLPLLLPLSSQKVLVLVLLWWA